jgi:hypothetical protein
MVIVVKWLRRRIVTPVSVSSILADHPNNTGVDNMKLIKEIYKWLKWIARLKALA